MANFLPIYCKADAYRFDAIKKYKVNLTFTNTILTLGAFKAGRNFSTALRSKRVFQDLLSTSTAFIDMIF
jgi:hypothetical protein